MFVLVVVGSLRLKIPRRASIQGIDDSRAAKAYDRISRMPQFGLIRRDFVRKLKEHTVNGSITDIGCGPGYLVQLIAQGFTTEQVDRRGYICGDGRKSEGQLRLTGA